MLIKSTTAVLLFLIVIMITAFLPTPIFGNIFSFNSSNTRDKYTFTPKIQYRIIVAIGPYDGQKQFGFYTDKKGSIKWNFWKDFHQNEQINGECKNITSPEKVTFLVENLHKIKRVINEFLNYAELMEVMTKTEGKLCDTNSINFNSLTLASPDRPNDMALKNEKKDKGKQKMVVEQQQSNYPELNSSKNVNEMVKKQEEMLNYYGQLSKQNDKAKKEKNKQVVNIRLDDISNKNDIELHIVFDKNEFGDKNIGASTKTTGQDKATTSSYPVIRSPPSAISMHNIRRRQSRNKNVIAQIINVIGDGNCLYRSVAVSLYGHDDGIAHKQLRKATAETLTNFETDPRRSPSDQTKMKVIIRENLARGDSMSNYHHSVAEYARRYVSRDGNYAGIAECHALPIYLNRHFAVIEIRRSVVTVFHPDFTQTEYKNFTSEKYVKLWELEENPIVIWHNGNEHFNSIRLQQQQKKNKKIFSGFL